MTCRMAPSPASPTSALHGKQQSRRSLHWMLLLAQDNSLASASKRPLELDAAISRR
jgi:hypothetical protein